MRALGLVVLLAACGGGDSGIDDGIIMPDASTHGDASPCSSFVTFVPAMAVAGPDTEIRAIANVINPGGVSEYTWMVRRGGATVDFDIAQADGSAITFTAAVADSYDVTLFTEGPGGCPSASGVINVGAPNAQSSQLRLRVLPPSGIAAPPSERLVLVPGGANYALGTVAIDPGIAATGTVRGANMGVQAYLRFMPYGARDAYVETFSSATGAFEARVLNQPHEVLVIPLAGTLPPKRIENWTPGTQTLALDAGVAIAGVVRAPNGSGLPGAAVQLALDGLPTTLATTNTNGEFTVRAATTDADSVTIEVMPPASTGLPRLRATSDALDLTANVAIAYDPALTVRDVAGAVVRRGTTAQPGAEVTIVGTLAAGSVVAGTTAPAIGEVRATATTTSTGALPSLRVPAATLSAVTAISATDLAVSTFDATSSVPATIDAPAMTPVSTQLLAPNATAAQGAVLEATPQGALALAGLGAVRVVSTSGGTVSARLAAGGRYTLRISDPAGRGSPLDIPEVTAASLASSYTLRPALRITGSLVLTGNPMPVSRAALQALCTSCDGIDRTRPLSESSAAANGDFSLAVFDPGTM